MTHQPLSPGRIVPVASLLGLPGLALPPYQRPYKWTTRHVQQLLADIAAHRHKSAYRLGTVVLHRHQGRLDIVDGQQRTVSLLLLLKALNRCNPGQRADLLARRLQALEAAAFAPRFDSSVSHRNVRANYAEIARQVELPGFDDALVAFLLDRCQVVVFELDDMSEAFQFFDAQNARGRDLDPHDLLKAYHLREFLDDEVLKARVVAHWENTGSAALAGLFADYLYRMRNWTRGRRARHFGKDDIRLFKGVTLERGSRHPYAEGLRIAHHVVDDYNAHYHRKVDGAAMRFPFRIDQPIVNGRRFFEMTAHYQERLALCRGDLGQALARAGVPALDGHAPRIVAALSTYRERHRRGDAYVRTMFDCLLACYLDKFGTVAVSRAIEKTFAWAYRLRLEMVAVGVASMDNHVIDHNLFRVLAEAVEPRDFLDVRLPLADAKEQHRPGEIYKLFQDMRYVK